MGFRFQRRLNLGSGTGLNFSKSGIGASARGRHGSIGTSGFSLRTGIPGLSYRQSWGKRGDGAVVMLILGLLTLTAFAVVAFVQAVLWLVPVLFQAGRWCVLTAQDYIAYRRTGVQSGGDQTSPNIEDHESDPTSEKTFAEILAEQEHSAPVPRLAPSEELFASSVTASSKSTSLHSQ